jgi:uncharacterized protein
MNQPLLRIRAKPIRVVLLIFIFYVFPPAAIVFHLIPFSFRFFLLMAIAPVLFFVRPAAAITNQDFGITRHNLGKSIVAIIPITLGLALLTVVSAAVSPPRYDNSGLSMGFYLFYGLISCPFQEFAYRGYLFPALALLPLGKWARIMIAAVLYSFVHIIYTDTYILCSTLMSGLLWNIHYDKYRNLAGVTFSHVILGVLIIGLGLI